jgi:hypothetical protein
MTSTQIEKIYNQHSVLKALELAHGKEPISLKQLFSDNIFYGNEISDRLNQLLKEIYIVLDDSTNFSIDINLESNFVILQDIYRLELEPSLNILNNSTNTYNSCFHSRVINFKDVS